AMVEGYVSRYRIPVAGDELRREALEWATTRGARSGRVAWQYVQDLAGRLGVALSAWARPAPLRRRSHQAPLRYCEGSTGVAPLRISKCSCGEVTLPVWPDFAITWPRFTLSPRLTMISLACA